MSLTTTISYTDGSAALTNLTANSVAYVTPGNALTIAPQSSTGFIQWTLVIKSDYGPLNGYTVTQNVLFSQTIPLPQQPCTLFITSEATDGNNIFQTSNTLYCFPSVKAQQSVHAVRFVGTTNANIAAINVNTAQDSVAGAQGDRILLVNQTNAAQNGPYIVGAVTANLAPLVRPPDWNSGSVVVSPQTFEVSEGTTWSLSSWKVTTTGNVTVDTTNVAIFPRVAFHGNIANLSANGNVTGLWLVANAATVAIAVSVTTANAPVRTSVINANAGVGGTGYVTFVPGVANDSGNGVILNGW